MTRVLALVTDAYAGQGGIAQAARDLIGALAEQDSIKSIDVLPRGGNGHASGLPRKVCEHNPLSGRAAYSARALSVARRARPDLVLCNHLFMAPLAAFVAKLVGARLLIQLHGVEIWAPPTALQRRALETADLLLCVSRDTRAKVLTYADVVPERVIVLNNTVGVQFTPNDRLAARAKFGLGDAYVILTTGRIDARERYKGHDRIIAALPQLSLSGLGPLLYLIAGSGSDQPRLDAAADAAGVTSQVRFLGHVPAADLPDLYRAADLFCLPSTGEGFGISFLEAMRSGTPALGLSAGGAADALGDGELGALASTDASLAEALLAAIRATPRAGLADRVAARFGPAIFKDRVAAVLALLVRHD